MKNGHAELNQRFIYMLLCLTVASSRLLGKKLNNTGNVISPSIPPRCRQIPWASTVQGIATPPAVASSFAFSSP